MTIEAEEINHQTSISLLIVSAIGRIPLFHSPSRSRGIASLTIVDLDHERIKLFFVDSHHDKNTELTS